MRRITDCDGVLSTDVRDQISGRSHAGRRRISRTVPAMRSAIIVTTSSAVRTTMESLDDDA
jgi:hypothetical protein